MEDPDIIELPSSDDEANEPAPKQPRKNPPMVSIPRDVVQSAKQSPLKRKGKLVPIISAVGSLRVENSKNKTNPLGRKTNPVPIRNINNQVSVIPVAKGVTQTAVRVQAKQSPSTQHRVLVFPTKKQIVPPKLPPDITIKKTISKIVVPNINNPNKRISLPVAQGSFNSVCIKPKLLGKTNFKPNPCNVAFKQLPRKKPTNYIPIGKKQTKYTPTGEVLPVEIDDSPRKIENKVNWYMKPEDFVESSMQKANETEPSNEMIEIVIEDSPAKPPKTDFIEFEVEATPKKNTISPTKQYTKVFDDIVIEDSPAKPDDNCKEIPITPQSNLTKNKEIVQSATPQSKKKLEFPKPEEKHKSDNAHNTEAVKENHANESAKTNDINGEFHPLYQEFIDLCFEIEKSDDMEKIIERKVKNYYRQIDRDYTNSHAFLYLLQEKINSIKNDSDNLFLYIKDVVDELKIRRKTSKPVVEAKDDTSNDPTKTEVDEEEEKESAVDRNVRKLEKTLFKLHRTIQKLEEQEVEFDDEMDSVYLLTEKYKTRLIRVHNKLNQLRGTKMPAEGRVKLEPAPGKSPGPTKKLEKWINKMVPVGAPLPFPDFHDVLKCVKEANTEDNLGMSELEIEHEARELFTRCGKKLQRRRQQNEWRTASVWLPNEPDPADIDGDLKKRLEENKKQAKQREKIVIDRFAEKQHQLKLEAEEVKEDDADKSDNENESDDDLTLLEEENAVTADMFRPKTIKEEVIDSKDEKIAEETKQKENEENKVTTKENTESSCSKHTEDENTKGDTKDKDLEKSNAMTEKITIDETSQESLLKVAEKNSTCDTTDKNTTDKSGTPITLSEDSMSEEHLNTNSCSDSEEINEISEDNSESDVEIINMESSEDSNNIAKEDTSNKEETEVIGSASQAQVEDATNATDGNNIEIVSTESEGMNDIKNPSAGDDVVNNIADSEDVESVNNSQNEAESVVNIDVDESSSNKKFKSFADIEISAIANEISDSPDSVVGKESASNGPDVGNGLCDEAEEMDIGPTLIENLQPESTDALIQSLDVAIDGI